MACTTYCVEIEEIFDAMIRLANEVLPENRRGVEYYIHRAWRMVTVFVQSFKREEETDEARSKFESHITAEEARLRRNLEDIRYQIDGPDTFQVVTGEGKLEAVRLSTIYFSVRTLYIPVRSFSRCSTFL